MKKLLYIAPHLSTGGLPQYLVKKIQLLKNEFDIHLVEWVDCTGGVLVVQRNKLLDLVNPTNFHTLGEDKNDLFNIISNIKPDIIHLEEIPEYFMDSDIAQKLYSTGRSYNIVETSHDSSFDTSQKRFFPDKFMFVSDWQVQQYKDLDIPKVLVEYPIEYIDRPDREISLKSLGLNPDKKHILHVGLFTPRKNQEEFFKYARSLPEYEFHCLGNQAENFKHYWEPLMGEKPPNLTWWGERTDVGKFYESMDLFLFTSRGTNNDKETMPLVIREAISNKIPQLLYNLPVYLNYFDKFDSIKYLEENNFELNCGLIIDELSEPTRITQQDEVFVISTHPTTENVINTTLDCVKAVQNHGYKVILTSHIPLPEVLQKQADYCVVDNNNVLTKHTYYSNFNWGDGNYKAYVNLKGENNDVYHGPAVYTNNYNGASLASSLDFKKAYFLNYDYILSKPNFINYISGILDKTNFYFSKHHPTEGDALYTYFFAGNPKELLRVLPKIESGEQYDNLMEVYGSESNGLENLFHHIFKNEGATYREEEIVFDKKSKEIFEHRDFSQVEYFTILPTGQENQFAPYFYISSDSRNITYEVKKDGNLFRFKTLLVQKSTSFYDTLELDCDVVEVIFTISDGSGNSHKKSFIIDQNYYNNILPNNGNLTLNN
jgi:glycosyltransferase involved in cell wall biosynthesis